MKYFTRQIIFFIITTLIFDVIILVITTGIYLMDYFTWASVILFFGWILVPIIAWAFTLSKFGMSDDSYLKDKEYLKKIELAYPVIHGNARPIILGGDNIEYRAIR